VIIEGVKRLSGKMLPSEAHAGSARDPPIGIPPVSTPSPSSALRMIRTLAPSTHGLPAHVIWGVTMGTAVIMAFANFLTIGVVSYIVEWKFNKMQELIDTKGQLFGVLGLVAICSTLASLCQVVVWPISGGGAAGSGAPENKGFLNGNPMPDLFTSRNLICRAVATILANASGFPVGREGPTVTMGSNLAYLLTNVFALPHVLQQVDVDSVGKGCTVANMIDEERFSHAKRIVCTVGGACGMAMLFDSPVGGIVYMFEEITAASWPLEVTIRAFAGTTVCALLSRALLNLCGTTTKEFVVYEWNPEPQPWTWQDVPFFLLLAVFLGPFSAMHTRLCLNVATWRQAVLGAFRKCGSVGPKVVDAIFYAALCSSCYACVSLLATCQTLPDEALERLWVRYNCEEKQYNPVASLILTTSEGSVKRLFSRRNVSEIHWKNEFLAFVTYSILNIGLTGVSVPSGNFTGSMLIGGLAGRIMGALVRDYGPSGCAVSGVYAMVGAASMLCGFKQMCLAVVIIITGCANDFDLIPPLMLSVTVSLTLNQAFNVRGFDEEQILRKNIPFLNPDPPLVLDRYIAEDLRDHCPEDAVLPPEAPVDVVERALACKEVQDFPVCKGVDDSNRICFGFTTRNRLDAALEAMNPLADRYRRKNSNGEIGQDHEMSVLISAAVGRETSTDGTALVPVARLADKAPYTILATMAAPRMYALFAGARIRVACVTSEAGLYRGMISRGGLIQNVRKIEADAEKEEEEAFG